MENAGTIWENSSTATEAPSSRDCRRIWRGRFGPLKRNSQMATPSPQCRTAEGGKWNQSPGMWLERFEWKKNSSVSSGFKYFLWLENENLFWSIFAGDLLLRCQMSMFA